jgi:uncharacterized protein (UPF0264 family)
MDVYTPEDIKLIAQAPMMTGLSVAMIDMGIVSTAIEAAAMSKQIAGAAEKYPHNSIIQVAFSAEALKGQQAKLDKPDVSPESGQADQMIDQAIADITTALQVVEGKATATEIAEYKQFIYDCGVAVAKAAGNGLLGFGTKVSDKEAAALSRLKLALGL